jgi:alpha-L-arabinofuranosidase
MRRLLNAACQGLLAMACSFPTTEADDTPTIVIDGKAPRVSVNPRMYGIFFEEINHAGEGGIYPELVQNRDFEAHNGPAGARFRGNHLVTPRDWVERVWFNTDVHAWTLIAEGGAKGSIRLMDEKPLNEENPHSMRLRARNVGTRLGVANHGFWGMNFRKGAAYDLSFYARADGNETFDLTITLESSIGHKTYAKATLHGVGGGAWKQYRASLTPDADDPTGRLVIAVSHPGTIYFDVVSLFPRDTYKNRPNGLRPDLVRMLADLKPGFIRFPGGCIVEGIMLSNRFQWKHSIGDIARRQGTFDLWGYYNTFGLGFHEYLQLCEDLNADAMYVINAGLSCQFRREETVADTKDLGPLVQDTLDALEYAMGPATSKWGGRRAANGHPEPFAIRYVEIGNENWGPVYHRNYKVFYDAIKAKYPQVITIADSQDMGGAPIEVADDHYYNTPGFFFDHAGQYDRTSREGRKIYVGEYAVNRDVGRGNLMGALAEAAFLIGLERNADLVRICSYAPLFVNVNDRSWPVNLIEFDSSRVVGRTSYHVQKLFASNRPDEVLKTSVEGQSAEPDVFALSGVDREKGEIVLKIVNRAKDLRLVHLRIGGVEGLGSAASVTTLSHEDPTAENTLDDPEVVVPVASKFTGVAPEFGYGLPPHSLTILRFAGRVR